MTSARSYYTGFTTGACVHLIQEEYPARGGWAGGPAVHMLMSSWGAWGPAAMPSRYCRKKTVTVTCMHGTAVFSSIITVALTKGRTPRSSRRKNES
eukprot:1110861-Prorocentrum_minimum.AAC.1